MRKLSRIRKTLKVLKVAEGRLTSQYKGEDSGFKPRFSRRTWRNAEVLGTLYAIHGKACAFCQGLLTQSDRGDVEHYRPTSLYWWLAYDIRNYLLSCSRCNRIHKKGEFPLEEEESRANYTSRTQIHLEPRLLACPYDDNVEAWMEVRFWSDLWIVACDIRETSNDRQQAICSFTRNFFELNVNPMLVKERTNAISDALSAAKDAKYGDKTARLKVLAMANHYAPHGVYVRGVIKKKFPELVPSPDQEIEWLVKEMMNELDICEKILRIVPGSADATKVKEIVCCALASLWNSSSPNHQRLIEGHLRGAGYAEHVGQLRDRILREEHS